MAAPYSKISERDLSFKVIGRSTLSAGIVIPNAQKGDTTKPVLVSTQTEFLDAYTATGTLDVGVDNAYYSAMAYLEQGTSLFVRRAIGAGALLAGTNFGTAAAPVVGTATAGTLSTITLLAPAAIGDVIQITAGKGTGQSASVTAVALNVATVAPAFVIAPDNTSVYAVYTPATPLAAGLLNIAANVFGAADTVLFTAANVGVWGNSVHVKVLPYMTATDPANPQAGVADPFNVGEPNAFKVEVYLSSDLHTPVEVFTCSRNIAHIDGFNKNIYVDDVLASSAYIRGTNNLLLANTVLPSYTPAPVALAAGLDGAAANDGDLIIALQDFTNTISYPVTIMLDGGRATAPYQAALITLCEARNDCISLLSVPYATEQLGAQAVVDYRNITLNANTSFAAIYTSWVQIYDRFNGRTITVSPEGFVGAIIAQDARNGELWDVPAGERRGVLNVRGVAMEWSQGAMDLLYDNNVNPILRTVGAGNMVWGQKTLQTRPSDTDRLNVRLMLTQIEPAIRDAMRLYVFEINDVSTRKLAYIMIDTYMNDIKSRGGVFDYKVVIDESNNTPATISQNKMNMDIYVKASIAAEFINTTVVMTPRGLSFTGAQAL